jgi:hypothetical protein
MFQTARAECVPSRRYGVIKLTKFLDGPEGDPWENFFSSLSLLLILVGEYLCNLCFKPHVLSAFHHGDMGS